MDQEMKELKQKANKQRIAAGLSYHAELKINVNVDIL
jgi:hypothetical protein